MEKYNIKKRIKREKPDKKWTENEIIINIKITNYLEDI